MRFREENGSIREGRNRTPASYMRDLVDYASVWSRVLTAFVLLAFLFSGTQCAAQCAKAPCHSQRTPTTGNDGEEMPCHHHDSKSMPGHSTGQSCFSVTMSAAKAVAPAPRNQLNAAADSPCVLTIAATPRVLRADLCLRVDPARLRPSQPFIAVLRI